MESLQQTVFKNIGQSTLYNYDSKKFTDKHTTFPKYRYQQIQNQFELVDLHNKGLLTQKQIVKYLSEKYQWVNISILKQIFKTMQWENGAVSKKQFTQKYLSREKKLYHDITGLKYYNTWTRTLQEIFNQQIKKGRPRAYFFSQIKSLQLYYDGKPIEWMDLKIQYENHENKINYEIEEAAHEASHPSFEIWLPSQKDNFFLTFKFLHPKTQQIYGQCYISIPLEKKIQKITNMNVQITRLGKKVGNCHFIIKAETSMERVREQMKQIKEKSASYSQIVDDKIKQYQYLQFLWGVKHRSPHKITHLDAAWMLILRTIFIALLAIIGLVIQVLGRCEPLCLILAFLLLRNREYVLLRNQKFLITWIVLASILIDIVWIVVASGTPSQINFISLESAETLTYFLLVVKALLFGYLLFFERSFDDTD